MLWVTRPNSILNLGTGEGRYDAKVHSKLATEVSKLRGRSQICLGKFVSGRPNMHPDLESDLDVKKPWTVFSDPGEKTDLRSFFILHYPFYI